MSYPYAQRTTSQPPPHRDRYDYSDEDDDGRPSGPSDGRYNPEYTDRGRVFAQRSWIAPPPQGNYGQVQRTRPHPHPRGSAADNGALTHYPQREGRDPYYSRSRSRRRSKSHGRHRDRSPGSSRSRSSSRSRVERLTDTTKNALDKTFDTRGKGLGAGVVGALIGGAVGRRIGSKHDNHALAGAIVGGLGLNIIENQVHRHRQEKREEKEWEQWDEDQARGHRRRSR